MEIIIMTVQNLLSIYGFMSMMGRSVTTGQGNLLITVFFRLHRMAKINVQMKPILRVKRALLIIMQRKVTESDTK